ncbi:MAG: hypothetical protein R3F33_03840 [Planctomycetota bacterium]
MWHLNFLARTLLVLLVLCGSAWPAQNPRWWQGEQEARFNDCLDRLDRDRLGPDYIPQLLERVESASITPQGESSDSAEAYLELLFLKINPTPALKANQDRNRNGEPYATWPSGWGMTRLTLPLIGGWAADDDRWLLPFAFLEDCLISTNLAADSPLFDDLELWEHLEYLRTRFNQDTPEQAMLVAILARKSRCLGRPLEGAQITRPWLAQVPWQTIANSNIGAHISLSLGEFDALLAEGRILEANSHSKQRYREACAALSSDPTIEDLFRPIVVDALMTQQVALKNWRFCYDFAMEQWDSSPSQHRSYSECATYLRGLRCLLSEAVRYPQDVRDSERTHAVEILHATLDRTWPPLVDLLARNNYSDAQQLPSTSGLAVCEYLASSGSLARALEVLESVDRLPDPFRTEPRWIQTRRIRWSLVETNGAVSDLREEGRAFYASQWEEALKSEAQFGYEDSGSDRLGSERLGIPLEMQLLVEWSGVQGNPISEEATQWILASQVSGTLARGLGAPTPTLAALQESILGEDEAVLLLHFGQFYVSALLFDSDAVRLFHLGSPLELPTALRATRNSFLAWHHIPTTEPPDWEKASQGLTGLLFPVELRAALEELDPSVLYLTGSLDDEYLPWEALPWSGDQTFGERFALAYLPSMVVGVALAERAQTSPPVSPTLAQLLVTDEPLTGGRLDFDVDQESLLEAYGNPGDSWDRVVFLR